MRGLWLEEALAGADDAPRLAGDVQADVCVVGGGYTGLWTALRVRELEPSARVVLLEADVCGGGPSGRNGGMLLSWWSKFGTLEAVCGTDEALRLAHASARAVAAIGAFCDEHGIDAQYRRDGWLWSATSSPWIGAWRSTIDRLERLGVHPFRELEGEEVSTRTGSPRQLAAAFEETGAIVQPALLARGLRRVALERGVEVFERSPVVALERAGPRTRRGRVRADAVVLALGPWAIQLRGLGRALVVVSSDVIATSPVPDRLEAIGWHDGVSVSDARARTEYYRPTRDGCVVFGKGGGTLAFGSRIGPSFHGQPAQVAEVEAAFRRVYPALADVPVDAAWTGPIDRSRTGLPFFLRVRERVVAGAGYSGRGVGQSYLGGRILASLALGREDEWSTCGLVRAPANLPPEPFRYLGGRVLRAAVAAAEQAEDDGRRPPRLAAAATALAPPGLVPRHTPRSQGP
jgi:glycine/D-amino acid oxidase-like deaminating enzyme